MDFIWKNAFLYVEIENRRKYTYTYYVHKEINPWGSVLKVFTM